MPFRMTPCRFLVVFTVLSALDLLLTSHLLFSSDGFVYETNPIAGWFLAEFGWAGLAAFKLIMVLLVMSLAAIVYRYRPRTGQHLLAFGCAVVALVVAYSSALAAYVAVRSEPAVALETQRLEESNRRLDCQIQTTLDSLRFKRRLSEELLSGRLALDEAVIQLTTSPTIAGTDVEYVAAQFVQFTIGTVDEPAAQIVRNQLESELWRCYGISLPMHSCSVPDRAKTIWMAGEIGKVLRQMHAGGWGAFTFQPFGLFEPF